MVRFVESHSPSSTPHSVMHTTPLWRLLGVILAIGSLGLAGYGLNIVGHIDDAATILSVTIVYTIGFWARRQKGRLQEHLGPFHRIGVAIVESDEEVRAWAARRTLLAGVLVAALAGVGIALLKGRLEGALGWLAAALGCAVGALVVARSVARHPRLDAKGRQVNDDVTCEHCRAYRATLREIGLILDLRGSSDADKLADIGGELDACRAPIE